MNRRILVIAPPGRENPRSLSEAFRLHAPALAVDLAGTEEAPVEGGYDAVVCWAEGPQGLDQVVRIRGTDPGTPILLVSPETGGTFRDLALAKGATSLLPDARSLPALVGLIEQAVQGRGSPRRLERPFRIAPLPLLISDDPEEACLLVQAFAKAEMFAPLPLLRTAEEAIAYLTGAAPYQIRERYPLPSLILLDLKSSGIAGLGLLGWIRQQIRFRHLPVIVLSAALNPEDIRGAYGLQANSYLIKPGNFDELVEMVKAIKQYWSSLNVQLDP